ncbi:MAG: hypothetical protein JL57_05465 [Desulfosporosinus sp. BICA1-9]|nr:MAG: hypothetical protein JL57_05465 [Desulfosporosinus sp. BICA1-9]
MWHGTCINQWAGMPDVLDYATNLRTWLEQIPSVPLSKPLKPYVDYLYEKAFQANCVEAD